VAVIVKIVAIAFGLLCTRVQLSYGAQRRSFLACATSNALLAGLLAIVSGILRLLYNAPATQYLGHVWCGANFLDRYSERVREPCLPKLRYLT